MDLLVQLAEIKQKSSAYIFNNQKIRKIVSIQRKKEAIKGTIEKIRQKIVRWRKFTRTTLVDEKKPELVQIEEEADLADSQVEG